ncbi:ARID DNA-binding domain-containing protein [Tanacetum coccineum]
MSFSGPADNFSNLLRRNQAFSHSKIYDVIQFHLNEVYSSSSSEANKVHTLYQQHYPFIVMGLNKSTMQFKKLAIQNLSLMVRNDISTTRKEIRAYMEFLDARELFSVIQKLDPWMKDLDGDDMKRRSLLVEHLIETINYHDDDLAAEHMAVILLEHNKVCKDARMLELGLAFVRKAIWGKKGFLRRVIGHLDHQCQYSLSKYSQRKRISFECKEILKKRLKEIETFNASNMRAAIKEKKDRSAIARKDKRARCYVCRKRGHVFWKCPNKKSRTTIEVPTKDNNSKKPTDMRIEEKLKYPENVHVKTNYMIEGTDFSNWDNIWYVSSAYKKHMSLTKSLFKRLKNRFRMEGTEENEKKFIFSYGIGEAVVETNENEIVIPCVLYTPEVTLNVLSLDQLLAQGFVITYGHNKCRISYMFGEENMVYDGDRDRGKGKECEIDTREMVAKHNKFLEEYFESIDPKDACPLIKGLEELEWDKDMEHDYLDDDYISVNGTLYAIKVNSFQRFISFLNLIKDDKLVYENWSVLSKRFEDMLKWFYLIYLGRDVLETLPPIIGGVKIDLMGLYKMVDSMGGYLGVSFGNKWKDVALIHGLTKEHDEVLKECYK